MDDGDCLQYLMPKMYAMRCILAAFGYFNRNLVSQARLRR